MFKNSWSRLAAIALCATLAACGGNETNNKANSSTANSTSNNMTTNMTTNINPNNVNVMTNCEGVANSCATAGSSCDGSSAVVCAADANGCLVAASTDCTVTAEMCMGGACIPVQACSDDPACVGLTDGSRFCTADVLTTCADNGAGCLVPSTNDCAAAGQSCDMDTQACVTSCTDDVACAGLAEGDSFCDGAGYTTCAMNAMGCFVGTPTACNAGETCDDTAGAASCAAACAESLRVVSCADAGTPFTIDSANGTNLVTDNGCNTFGDSYDAQEVFLTFSDMGNYEVTVDFTYDNLNIDVDAFALADDGMCTDATLTCEGFDYAFSGAGSLQFDAAADQTYFLLFEPYLATGETTNYDITISCTPVVCGDSILAGNEDCDDGNIDDGDGCSALCLIEDICGNGVITGAEECDDGDLDDGDGCDMNCVIEATYICNGEPSMCLPDVCGDGTVSPNETCDDGDLDDGDGCDSACDIEFGYECDTTGTICTMLTSIGSFGAGDAIPNTTGGPIAGSTSKQYLITFTEDVFLSGTATVGATGDVDLAFLDADGNYVAGSAADGDETFAGQFLAAGTYVVDLYAYDDGITGDVDTYTLTLSTTAFTPTDKGTFAAAAVIADSTGPVLAGESEWLSITFSDDVFLSGSLTADTGDADLYVHSTTGQVFTSFDNVGDETITDLPLPAGTYYFRVFAYPTDGDIGAYTLSLSTTALVSTALGSFAGGDTIADVTGTLLDGTSDWYSITFSAAVTLTGTLVGTTGESGVFMYNSTTFAVSEFDLGDEAFSNMVPAGTYLIRVVSNPGDGDVAAYTLTLDPS